MTDDTCTFTLDYPLTDEQWDMIQDVDLEKTNNVWFHTKHNKEVEFVKVIRCKDCKFWNKHDGTFPDFDGKEWHECKQLYPFTSASGDSAVTPSWFYCGYAERTEE